LQKYICYEKKNNIHKSEIEPLIEPLTEPSKIISTIYNTPQVIDNNGLRAVINRVPIGVALNMEKLEKYSKDIVNNFNLLVTENDMKMSSLHPKNTSPLTFDGDYNLQKEYKILKGELTPGYTPFDFTAGYLFSDYNFKTKYLEFAKVNNMTMRCHVLVYQKDYQIPKWLEDEKVTRKQAICAIMRHTYNIVNYYKTNYPGIITSYDVVNEHLDMNKNEHNIARWSNGVTDTEYIIASFIAARKADPNVKLFYTDYRMEKVDRKDKNSRLYQNNSIIKNINNNYPGLINCVGFQGHINLDFAETTNITSKLYIKKISDYMNSTIIPNIEVFTNQGFEVQITEFDIGIFNRRNLKYWGSHNDTIWTQTAIINFHTVYAEFITQLYTYFNKNQRCTAFCFWGFIDQKSWIYNKDSQGNQLKGTNKPLLFDMNPITTAITPKLNHTLFKNNLSRLALTTRPGTTKPAITKPGTTRPGTTKPGTTKPGTTKPRTTKPGTTKPGTTKPGTTKPKTTQPKTTQPKTTQPKTTQPKTTQPKTTVPGTTVPGTTVPGTTVPGTTVPGTTVPGTTQPTLSKEESLILGISALYFYISLGVVSFIILLIIIMSGSSSNQKQ